MKHPLFISITGVILSLGIIAMLYWTLSWRFEESTDNAYVVGHACSVSPIIDGNVQSIWFEENQYIEKGQILVELNPIDAELALQNQKAAVVSAVHQACQEQELAQQSLHQVAIARSALQKNQTECMRREMLILSNSVSQEELEQAQANYVQSQSLLKKAESQLYAAQVQASISQKELKLHPAVQSAATALKQAYVRYYRCSVYSPRAGFIAKKQVEVGDRVSPQSPIYSIASLSDVWIEANFKETQLNNLYIGQAAEVVTDLYGTGVSYRGKIDSIGIAAGTVFSLLPAQNSTGNWIKVVQRVPVKITLDPQELKQRPLFMGVSTTVTVDTKDRSGTKLSFQPQVDQNEKEVALYEENIPWELIEQEIEALTLAALHS